MRGLRNPIAAVYRMPQQKIDRAAGASEKKSDNALQTAINTLESFLTKRDVSDSSSGNGGFNDLSETDRTVRKRAGEEAIDLLAIARAAAA